MPLFEADERRRRSSSTPSRAAAWRRELADWVKENNSRLPIVAFMAGRFMDEMPGMSFGHAGTIVEGKADTATEKIARMQEAGISVAEEIADIPELVKERLGAKGRRERTAPPGDVHRRRGGRARSRRRRRWRASSPRSVPSTSSRSADDGTLEIVEENLDECMLCDLCVEAAPDGTVRVVKLYE